MSIKDRGRTLKTVKNHRVETKRIQECRGDIDQVTEGIKKLGIGEWKGKCQDRIQWIYISNSRKAKEFLEGR